MELEEYKLKSLWWEQIWGTKLEPVSTPLCIMCLLKIQAEVFGKQSDSRVWTSEEKDELEI